MISPDNTPIYKKDCTKHVKIGVWTVFFLDKLRKERFQEEHHLPFAVDAILAAVAFAVALPKTPLPPIGGLDGRHFFSF